MKANPNLTEDQLSAMRKFGETFGAVLVLAMALAQEPRILLLDEPAAGLNSAEVVGLMRLIQWIQKEFHLTVWLIEHQMKVVMNICTWIQVLDFGATIAEGTPDDIKQNKRVIDAYLGEGMSEIMLEVKG